MEKSVLEQALVTAEQLQKIKAPMENAIIGPILDPSITLLHAPAGAGKTLFVLELALSVVSGESCFDTGTNKPPGWKVESSGAVLQVDGEMSFNALQERVRIQKGNRNIDQLFLLPNVLYTQITDKPLDITLKATQADLGNMCVDHDIKVLILDNLATLTGPKFDENKAADQKGLNKWFSQLRDEGISVIFVHHDGKNQDQRGSSDRLTVVDLVIHLTKPELAGPDEAIFDVSFTKARWRGARPRAFGARFLASRWSFRTGEESKLEQLLDHMEITNEWDWRSIAIELDCGKSYVYRLRQVARDKGYWEDRWNPKKRRGEE